jgi:protein SCO1
MLQILPLILTLICFSGATAHENHDAHKQKKNQAHKIDSQTDLKTTPPEHVEPAAQEPPQFKNVTITEKLGKSVNLNLPLVNAQGETKPLKDFFLDQKPLILTLNYYGCGTLCSVQLNKVLEGLKGMSGRKPDDFKVLTVSFDPADTPSGALEKQQGMAEALKERGFSWEFAVADPKTIQELTNSVGFQYKYDEQTKQFAHSAAIYFVSPEGKLTRYIYGVSYPSRDMNFAILDAGLGKVGSSVEKLILRCFHFDVMNGRYTLVALNTVRVVAVFCALLLFSLMFKLWKSERNQKMVSGRNVEGVVRGA